MQLLLISSSNVHGYGYLDHAESEIKRILDGRKRVTFIPYALKDRAAYVAKVRERLAPMGFEVVERIGDGEAIFVGGGNTFRLLKTVYEEKLVGVIRERVRGGVPYIGSSAGTNAHPEPSSAASASPGDPGRSRMTTRPPAPRSIRTVASPSPEAPPVTMATVFAMSMRSP
jgi:peptidase E